MTFPTPWFQSFGEKRLGYSCYTQEVYIRLRHSREGTAFRGDSNLLSMNLTEEKISKDPWNYGRYHYLQYKAFGY